MNIKLPPCPICEEETLVLRRGLTIWGVHCETCGWDSGEHVCRDDSILHGLITQHIAVIAHGYNAIADKMLAVMANPPAKVMTGRQRNFCMIAQSLARDMRTNGTMAEKWTAALLELCADQVAAGNVAELVAAMRVWAIEREQQTEG